MPRNFGVVEEKKVDRGAEPPASEFESLRRIAGLSMSMAIAAADGDRACNPPLFAEVP